MKSIEGYLPWEGLSVKMNFEELTLEERRFILVASDRKYEELKSATDWGKVGKQLARLVPAFDLYMTVKNWNSIEGSNPPGTLSERFSKGEVPLPRLSPREAASRFQFDVGGPSDGAVYIVNPCMPSYYLAPALANERFAQEKLAAFLQIASALGAKSVEILSASVVSSSASGKATVPLAKTAAQIGLSANFDSDYQISRQVYSRFGPPSCAPHLPSELKAWLDMDPVLRALVQNRLEGEAEAARISLCFSDTIHIGAKIAAEFAGRGLDVGGTYRAVESSTWNFEIEYWPKRN